VVFTKFCLEREPEDRTLMLNFAAVVLKMWPYGHTKIAKNGNSW